MRSSAVRLRLDTNARHWQISTISRRPNQRPPSYEVLGVLLGIQILVKALLGMNRWRRSRRKAVEEAKAAARAASGVPLSEKEQEEQDEKARRQEREIVTINGVKWSHKSSPASLEEAGAGSTTDLEELLKHAPPGSAVAPLAYADADGQPLSPAALGLPEGASPRDVETAQAAAKGRAMELESIAQSVLRCTLCMEQRAPEKGGSAVTECGHVFCWDCISGWAKEKVSCFCRCSLLNVSGADHTPLGHASAA